MISLDIKLVSLNASALLINGVRTEEWVRLVIIM